LNWQYQYPQAFWLLTGTGLLLLIYVGYVVWKKKAAKRIGDQRLIKELTKSYSPLKSGIRFTLLLLSFALGCLALTNPRKPIDSPGDEKRGIDVVIALDVSNSMTATDVAPDRLQKAKAFINKLIDKLPNDRVGLVLFAGNAYVQMPLTFDHGAAKIYVGAATPGSIPSQGTAIGDAIEKSRLAFEEGSERFKSIVLITDGETHDENAVTAVQEAAAFGIMINTVGLGSPDGTTILDSAGAEKKDEAGNVVISKLNDVILKEIASTSKGAYVHLQNTDEAVTEITSQFTNIEKKALTDTSLYNYESFYAWLVLPMLLLLLTELFISDRKKVQYE
jgi:Ca-activated chloride channel homolog